MQFTTVVLAILAAVPALALPQGEMSGMPSVPAFSGRPGRPTGGFPSDFSGFPMPTGGFPSGFSERPRPSGFSERPRPSRGPRPSDFSGSFPEPTFSRHSRTPRPTPTAAPSA